MIEHAIECACSVCRARFKGARIAHGTEGAPVPGDPLVCPSCGARLIYDQDRMLRSLTPHEFFAFDINVRRAIDAARKAAMKGVTVDMTNLPLLAACAGLCRIMGMWPW